MDRYMAMLVHTFLICAELNGVVIAFDAHVLKWTLNDNPPDEFARHHIKEASFYGQDTWTVDLTIKHPLSGALDVDYIDRAWWLDVTTSIYGNCISYRVSTCPEIA